VGWNIVTSYLESGARNIGHQAQTDHDARYDYADEYLDVVYKLLEGSWEDGAVLRDRERGIFSDPQKFIRSTTGNFFTVPGIHLCEPSPQRTPVLYQAGASSRGNSLPPVTPSACLSPRRRKCCSKRRWRIFAAAPPKPGATRAAS
jgi:alkanesulfonate monooxygenase SsuD/methylene tetrahydromethanopterin reductase-like flavin-dependent oxidoreductase (luciferase family)